MRPIRPVPAAAVLTLLAVAASADRGPVPLNDYQRLGQRFTMVQAFTMVSVTVPSWSDNEGGLTLTLWDSPERKTKLAQQAFTGIVDNAQVTLRLPKALPAGAYYWEISDRTGETRIGLYADALAAESDDCVYLDGTPDRTRRFVCGMTPTAFPYTDTQQMVAALGSDAPEAVRIEAARQLAAMGGPEAIPALATLLADEQRSHLARFALEAMPDPAASATLRDALPKLGGELLVGVVNSLGERRDPEAVGALGILAQGAEQQVAAAAAVALGKIGTLVAADALDKALAKTPADARSPVYEGALDCAQRLLAQGEREWAAALYDRLRGPELPAAVRAAALRGAIVARQAGGLPLLLEQLRGEDPEALSVALWVAQHQLPGADATQALAGELPKLPAERQLLVTRALCNRGDAAALPAVLALAGKGEKSVRLAALSGLAQFPADSVTATLVETLADPDGEAANAAQTVLENLPGKNVDAAVTALLGNADGQRSEVQKAARLRALELVGARLMTGAVPLVLEAARNGDPEISLGALKVLENLAGPAEVPALLELLAGAATPEAADDCSYFDGVQDRRRRFSFNTSPPSALPPFSHTGKTEATPLNDYTRLGQRFTVTQAFDALSVTLPSWSDAEGGLTLTLWDSPQRTKQLARQSFADVPDNEWVKLQLPEAQPAGAYYWEISDRTGQTRIGLWTNTLGVEREAAEAAVSATCARAADPEGCAEKLLGLLPQAAPALKQAVLRLLHGLGGTRAFDTLLAATRDDNGDVRATAVRLLGEWKTADAAPDLLQLAKTSADPADRLLCLRSYLRLAGNKDVPADQRLFICRKAAALVQRDEEKKLLLGMLGGLESPAALPVATQFLDDAATKEEAAIAILSVAEKLAPGPDAAQALAPLQKAATSTANPDLAKRAEALLAKLKAPAQ